MKHHPTRSRLLRLAFCIAVLALSLGSPVLALTCGDTIYSDTTLSHDLIGCPWVGLVIGEDGVTLDLNGYQISGNAGLRGIQLNPGFDDIQVVGPGTITGFSTGLWAQDNERLSVQGVGFVDNRVAIYLHEISDSTIDGNQIFGSTWGINLYGIGVPADDNRILNNQIGDCSGSGAGIRLEGGDRHEVRSNYVQGCSAGVYLRGVSKAIVKANVVIENTTGISVGSGSAGPVSRNVVSGNKVYDNTTGIRVSSGFAATHPVEETLIDGNTLQGGTWGLIVDDALCTETHLIVNSIWGPTHPITDLGTGTVLSGNTCDGAPC